MRVVGRGGNSKKSLEGKRLAGQSPPENIQAPHPQQPSAAPTPQQTLSEYQQQRAGAVGKAKRRGIFPAITQLFKKNKTLAYVDQETLAYVDRDYTIKQEKLEKESQPKSIWKKLFRSKNRPATPPSDDAWDAYVEQYRNGGVDFEDTPSAPKHRPNNLAYFAAPLPEDEDVRQMAYDRYVVKETPPAQQANLDHLANRVKAYFHADLILITLLDEDKQHYHAKAGFPEGDIPAAPRSVSFCGHTILRSEPMVILDTKQDWRFANNPVIQGGGVRFYAGAPLVTQEGYNIGTICLMDFNARENFGPQERAKLIEFADVIMQELETAHEEMQDAKAIRMEQSLADFGVLSRSPQFSAFDQATAMIASAMSLSLVYVVRVTGKTSCVLVAATGFTQSTPRFDPALHIKVLRSDQGLLYQNPEKHHLGPEDNLPKATRSDADYVSGILIPIARQRIPQSMIPVPVPSGAFADAGLSPTPSSPRSGTVMTGFVLGAFTTDKRQIFGLEDLGYLKQFGQMLTPFLRQTLPLAR